MEQADEHAPDPERAQEMKTRYRTARRAGLDRADAALFAAGETPIRLIGLCVRRGATPEQIRRICL